MFKVPRKPLAIVATFVLFTTFYFARGRQAQLMQQGAGPAVSSFIRSLSTLEAEETASAADGIEKALKLNSLIPESSELFKTGTRDDFFYSTDFIPCDENPSPGDILLHSPSCDAHSNDWEVIETTSTRLAWNGNTRSFERVEGPSIPNGEACLCLRHKDFVRLQKN